MKILLDECVPWPLGEFLHGHLVTNPGKMGWSGLENGDLIELAAKEFDLFITADQNIRYQQNLDSRKIAIIELSTNHWKRIAAAADHIRSEVNSISPGNYRSILIP